MLPQIVSPRSLRALAAITALALTALTAPAQNAATQTTSTAAAPQLSPGVSDVLKLSQARVSDATVINYIQTSDRGYGALSAPEIVYLHEAGVSGDVVNAMLNKRKQLAEANVQLAQAQSASVASATPDAAATATTVQYAPTYTPAPTVTYCQPAPVSTVSVYYMPHTPMFGPRTYYAGSGYRSLGFGCGSSITYIGGSYARGGSRNGGSCYSFGRSGRSSFGRCR